MGNRKPIDYMEHSYPKVNYNDYLAEPIALPDGIEIENYIIASIIVEVGSKQEAYHLGQFAAVEQTTGTWVRVPAETEEVRRNHVAKLVGIFEIPFWEYEIPKEVKSRQYCIQIAFPVTNLINSDGSFNWPMMFTATIGNISMGAKLKLLDLQFPKSVLKDCKGPKFGIQGLRKILGVPKRPLLNNMVKPCTGHTCEVAGDLIYKAAVGGCDVVKDDELIADAHFNTLENRISHAMDAIDKANEDKGEKTFYTINITDNTPKVLENANKMQSMGANALMINYLVNGLPILKQLAEDPSIKIPILAHMDFAGVWYEDAWTGISSHLTLGKMPRLMGADIVVIPAPYGKAYVVPERFKQNILSCRYPLQNINQILPMPSGGITPGMVEVACNDAGLDILIGSGGGIHSHPDGPIEGAKGFRAAIDAVMEGKTAKEKARESEPLAKAMGLWGAKRTGV